MADHEYDDEIAEFREFLDEATGGDFFRETSALDEHSRGARKRGALQGADGFASFVEEQIRTVRISWLTSETYMQPLGVLANSSVQRVFLPDEDETLEDFANRLAREARLMKAFWTFVCIRTMVGSASRAAGPLDVDDEEEMYRALEAGELSLGVMWYAERIEGEVRQRRHGHLVDNDGKLGPNKEGWSEQRVALWERILN